MDLNNILLFDAIQGDIQDAEEDVNIRREVLPLINPFEVLSENKFIKLFRLNKALCREVIEMVTPYIDEPSRRSALDIQTKVLAVLRFFGFGSYQEITGTNYYVGISQASVSRSIKQVADALTRPEIFNRWVHFPRNIEEMENLRSRFYEKYQFPGIIGCIDCTHVSIIAPPRNDEHFPEHVFVNRKNYHSINVQLICDTNLRIINVNARFPGSTHDAYIWSHSQVSTVMERIYRRNPGNVFFLIGDSGYPTRPWILTPIEHPERRQEDNFNNAFRSIRSTIEQCNGVLKNRFRCLLKHRTLHYSPIVAGSIINACVVLHNMCIANNIPEPLNDMQNVDFGIYAIDRDHIDPNVARRINPDLLAGRQLQRNIANIHF